MARTRGAKNADHAEQRLRLARKIRRELMREGGMDASMRQLASGAKTSVTTLKHYFGDRQGLVSGVLESLRIDAAPHLARASMAEEGDVRQSLVRYLQGIREAWFEFGVGRIQAKSLAAGLMDGALGPSYVNNILEPLLGTAEQLLQRHQELRHLRQGSPRFAALELLSPLVLALLHQDSLSGVRCRPLDLDAFVQHHLDTFLRAHRVSPEEAEGL